MIRYSKFLSTLLVTAKIFLISASLKLATWLKVHVLQSES